MCYQQLSLYSHFSRVVFSFLLLVQILGNDSLVRELAFTARRMHATEAYEHGLLSGVSRDKEELDKVALATAVRIAALSPIAVQGTKINLNQARGRTVADGLEFAVGAPVYVHAA